MNNDDRTGDMFNGRPGKPRRPHSPLDLPKARKLRDRGMDQIEGSTEREMDGWKDLAYTFLCGYVAQNSGSEFMSEDIRTSAAGLIPDPHDLRAWGPVVNRAVRAGLIVAVRYDKQRSANCHGSPKPVWRKA